MNNCAGSFSVFFLLLGVALAFNPIEADSTKVRETPQGPKKTMVMKVEERCLWKVDGNGIGRPVMRIKMTSIAPSDDSTSSSKEGDFMRAFTKALMNMVIAEKKKKVYEGNKSSPYLIGEQRM